MSRSWTLSQAFAHYGAKGANPRWSWSARSADGATVVMTVWKDQINYRTIPPSYDSFGHETAEWRDRPGNRERRENLIWARDRCNGYCRVVITEAVDVTARPRSIRSCAPQDNMWLHIVDLDDATGEFRAEIVRDPNSA